MSNLNKRVHLFFYDGTAMTFNSDEIELWMEEMFDAVKKDIVSNGIEANTENIKKYCGHFLEKMNAEFLSVKGENVSFKKMHLAWGKEAHQNRLYWCAYVWILENKCGVLSTNMFGYMRMEMHEEAYNEIAVFKSDVKCANCDYLYPSMMKCSACKTERYCSSECQKSHWKVHKKVCCK